MTNEFDRILDECIDRLGRGDSLEQCLADYPEYVNELEPLLRAMTETASAYSFVPSVEAKRNGRQKFYAEMDRRRQPSFWQSLVRPKLAWISTAGVLALLVLSFVILRPVLWPGVTDTPPEETDSTLPGEVITAGMGRLIISVTDAPSAPDIDEVMLTITGLQVHMAGADETEEEQEQNEGQTQNQENNENQNENDGWINLVLIDETSDPPVEVDELTFNLLDYQNGLQTMVAVRDLDPGRYTQIRMEVSLVEIHIAGTDEDVYEEAKLSSNTLKFIHQFEIIGGEETELLFDIDALRSVHVTGNDKYMFRPVIQLTTSSQPQDVSDLEITTLSLPNGEVEAVYTSTTLSASGGDGSYTWSEEAGAELPEGLELNPATGEITGTPVTADDYTVTVRVTDGSVSPETATRSFELEIAENGVLQIITTGLPDAVEGEEYTGAVLTAVGGEGAYSWSSTDLPAGLSLSAEGLVSGTPAVNGELSFTVEVTDSAVPDANTDTQVIIIRITEAEAP